MVVSLNIMAEIYQRFIAMFTCMFIGLIVDIITIQINEAYDITYIISIPAGLGLIGFFYEELEEIIKSFKKI